MSDQQSINQYTTGGRRQGGARSEYARIVEINWQINLLTGSSVGALEMVP